MTKGIELGANIGLMFFGVVAALATIRTIWRAIQLVLEERGNGGPATEPYSLGTPVWFDPGDEYEACLYGKIIGVRDAAYYDIFTPDGITYFEIHTFKVSPVVEIV